MDPQEYLMGLLCALLCALLALVVVSVMLDNLLIGWLHRRRRKALERRRRGSGEPDRM